MKKVYMVCDYSDDRAGRIRDCPDIGVEYMGLCSGRILSESGMVMGSHTSSSIGWLRHDLIAKLDNPDSYLVIDLIDEETPERFT